MILAGTVACDASDTTEDTRRDTADAAASATNQALEPSSPAAQDSALSRPRVLIVGTSLTAGLGLDPQDAYPAILQRKADSAGYNVEIVNAGLSGETTAGARRRMEWLLREPAAAVVVESGANDGLRGLNIDSTRANLVAILRESKEALPEARLFVMQMEAPPNLGERYTQRFRETFGVVAAQEGAVLIPFLLDSVAGVRTLNQSDGIHPNEEGAEIVAQNVWRTLSPALSEISARGARRR